MSTAQIVYTYTDEAPALATRSFRPILNAFTHTAGVEVSLSDISLANRILAAFPEYLNPEQRVKDALAELGALTQDPLANIVKLPNISASLPQLKAAIAELQAQGYPLPDYPQDLSNEEQAEIKLRYDAVKGSAVNPVLREGNSDRRAPQSVKAYAKRHPHYMGEWAQDSASHVASMEQGDFYESEKSYTVAKATTVNIEWFGEQGQRQVLKSDVVLEPGEVIDASFMSVRALKSFLDREIAQARLEGILFSVHLKATMMKVSDPIIFGYVVERFFAPVIEKHQQLLRSLGVNFRSGFNDLVKHLDQLDETDRKMLEADLEACLAAGPDLAMVNSDLGISNLHFPNDVIIDASMPAMIRNGGKMWDKNDQTRDTKALIPDRSYAELYRETIDFCKQYGAFDPTTMGSVSNVGLMAQKAEEYGSHDKTFEIPAAGEVRVTDENGALLISHQVEIGDIWRMCQTKDAAIRNWVDLAVMRARATGQPAIFWLDEARAHDAQLIKKVQAYLAPLDTEGLDIRILNVKEATRLSLERAKAGHDTISVTGNVLRDYITDLFPILELGTSAKMLSIVPLMKGGGLFETGAGGSAPKHVQQFLAEGHLRWDSLGEFMALAASLEHLGHTTENKRALVLAKTLEQATSSYLENNKAPSRKVNELDNQGSHYFLARYWSEALAEQQDDLALKELFADLAAQLTAKETKILSELEEAQGQAVDIGGYYHPQAELVKKAMRPSFTLNTIIANFAELND
jgi:isocitrate dehydrogenase